MQREHQEDYDRLNNEHGLKQQSLTNSYEDQITGLHKDYSDKLEQLR